MTTLRAVQTPYEVIAGALFPASVEATRHTDAAGAAISFRIAASSKLSVDAELARIAALASNRAWLRVMGPFQWGGEWIAHGVLRENLKSR